MSAIADKRAAGPEQAAAEPCAVIHLRSLHVALTVCTWVAWAYLVATLPSPEPDWRAQVRTDLFAAAFVLIGTLTLSNPKNRR